MTINELHNCVENLNHYTFSIVIAKIDYILLRWEEREEMDFVGLK